MALATSNAGTADPQVNATPQYWQLYQVTQDGLTAFRKSSGPRGQQRRPRPRGQAAAHQRRRPHLDAHAAHGRPLLQRRARAAGATCASRSSGSSRCTARRPSRSTARSTAPRRACRTRRPARSTRGIATERADDHVPSHATRHRLAAEARAAAGRAAAAERGHARRSARTSRGSSAPARTSGRPTRRSGSSCSSATRSSRPGRRRRSPTATSTGSSQRFGLGIEAAVTQVERGQADWVVDDLPTDRLSELASRFSPQRARQPAAGRLVLRAQRQHQAVQRAHGAPGRQPRDRPQRAREALRRPAARRSDLPGAAAGLPGLRALLPVDARAERHPGRRPTSRARGSLSSSPA